VRPGPRADTVRVRVRCDDTCTVTPTASTNGRAVGLRSGRFTVPAGTARTLALELNPRRVAGLRRAGARHLRLRLRIDSRIGPQQVAQRTVALPG
jgi:hypothetical protein